MKDLNEYITPELEIIILEANGAPDSLLDPGDGPIDVNG